MLDIRPAVKTDIPQLIDLNNRWQYPAGVSGQSTAGFLLNAVFSESDYEKIIKAQEIVVAMDGDSMAGYYLVDNYSDTLNLRHNRELITQLTEMDIIDPTQRIGARAQAVVSIEYHNQGISRQMFDVLKPYILPKFDALFTVVSKLNPKLIAHQKLGWQVVHQDDDRFYVLYDFNAN